MLEATPTTVTPSRLRRRLAVSRKASLSSTSRHRSGIGSWCQAYGAAALRLAGLPPQPGWRVPENAGLNPGARSARTVLPSSRSAHACLPCGSSPGPPVSLCAQGAGPPAQAAGPPVSPSAQAAGHPAQLYARGSRSAVYSRPTALQRCSPAAPRRHVLHRRQHDGADGYPLRREAATARRSISPAQPDEPQRELAARTGGGPERWSARWDSSAVRILKTGRAALVEGADELVLRIPAFTSSVTFASITSSLTARPPRVRFAPADTDARPGRSCPRSSQDLPPVDKGVALIPRAPAASSATPVCRCRSSR